MARFLLLLLLAGLARAGDLFEGAGASPPVLAAYKAYLARDGNAVLAKVKAALESTEDRFLHKNLLGLAEQAIANAGEKPLHLGWELPEGVRTLTAGTELEREAGRERRRFKLIVGLKRTGSITGLSLVRYPDQMVIDLASGIGESGDYHSTRFGDFLWCRRRLETDEPSKGLYFLKITLKSGPPVDGWFLMTQAESSATPLIKCPRPEEALGSNPVLTFANFRSPEYRPFERRELDVSIDQDDAGGLTDEARTATIYEVLLENPEMEALRVGPHSAAEAPRVEKLPRGHYRLQLTYREQHQLGPITLTRDSATTVPFTIRP